MRFRVQFRAGARRPHEAAQATGGGHSREPRHQEGEVPSSFGFKPPGAHQRRRSDPSSASFPIRPWATARLRGVRLSSGRLPLLRRSNIEADQAAHLSLHLINLSPAPSNRVSVGSCESLSSPSWISSSLKKAAAWPV